MIPQHVCRELDQSSKLEWLETNGRGGFAMGTVAGVNTRRYHGLLIASLRPPVDRYLLLSRLEETVVGDPPVSLATAQYPGCVSPAGYRHLIEFRLDPFPVWTWDVGGAHVEKSLFLVQGEQTAVVQYRSTRGRRLRIAPMLAFRDYHSLSHANGSLDGSVREDRSAGALELAIRPYAGLPELRLQISPAASFKAGGDWYWNNEVLEELARGLDFREDLWRMGELEVDVGPDSPVFLVATIGARSFDAAEVAHLEEAERARRQSSAGWPLRARLEAAADQFVVRRQDGSPTILAGYPWFTDWGRDTMIALPGLLLARGRVDEAGDVISAFVAHLDRGLLPNRFPDRPDEQPEYNTADATLWLFQAVAAWVEATGEVERLRQQLYPALCEVIQCHIDGTRHGIRVDPADHLLEAGEPGLQLTWMDAKVGAQVITPRSGKPVEINALWYNALRLMAAWGGALGDESRAARFRGDADAVARSFERAFWNAERGCLYDVLAADGPDARLRPNQLFAVALPFPLLPAPLQRSLMRVVEAELLTPMGLRTLGPREPGYIGRYGGNPLERDSAYHQGTVWPWLLGPYVRAYLTAFGRTPETLLRCRALLRPLEKHLVAEGCLGQISEVFDGDLPQRPGGGPAQAWSVAELLQLLSVDLADRGAQPPAR